MCCFLATKHTSGFCPNLNLSGLNTYLHVSKFCMETLLSMLKASSPRLVEYITRSQGAHFHVPIHLFSILLQPTYICRDVSCTCKSMTFSMPYCHPPAVLYVQPQFLLSLRARLCYQHFKVGLLMCLWSFTASPTCWHNAFIR